MEEIKVIQGMTKEQVDTYLKLMELELKIRHREVQRLVEIEPRMMASLELAQKKFYEKD